MLEVYVAAIAKFGHSAGEHWSAYGVLDGVVWWYHTFEGGIEGDLGSILSAVEYFCFFLA